LPKHLRLTEAIPVIIMPLLQAKAIGFVTVSNRTKDRTSIFEKISRKAYSEPQEQLTDITGIRIVVFTESDVTRTSELVEQLFTVDESNSMNQDELLKTNQIGYRSVHYVCKLGETRSELPEYQGLRDLKFEIQIRTILQHAWAELSHDRNYKFRGKLPHDAERKLYLYAGLLEVADKGLDVLSKELDDYVETVRNETSLGTLSSSINSLSATQYINKWLEGTGVDGYPNSSPDTLASAISELEQFGIETLLQLDEIAPKDIGIKSKLVRVATNYGGILRLWMIKSDWRKYIEVVNNGWYINRKNLLKLEEMLGKDELSSFEKALKAKGLFRESAGMYVKARIIKSTDSPTR